MKTKKNSRRFLSPGPSSQTELGLFVEKIKELVERDPRKAAIILTEWVNGPSTVKKDAKKKAG